MDRHTGSALFAALLLSLSLSACGGGSSTAAAADPDPVAEDPVEATVDGVATPSSVSVVTAKNAAQ